jgi:hypothetical protein
MSLLASNILEVFIRPFAHCLTGHASLSEQGILLGDIRPMNILLFDPSQGLPKRDGQGGFLVDWDLACQPLPLDPVPNPINRQPEEHETEPLPIVTSIEGTHTTANLSSHEPNLRHETYFLPMVCFVFIF